MPGKAPPARGAAPGKARLLAAPAGGGREAAVAGGSNGVAGTRLQIQRQ